MIKRLRAKNFRSLRSLSLDLGLKNVLVGPNLSGKSNVLDAFRLLRDMLVRTDTSTLAVASAFNRRLGFSEVAWKGDEPRTVAIGLDGEFPRTAVVEDDETFEVYGEAESWTYDVTFATDRSGWIDVQDEHLVFDMGDRRVNIVESVDGRRRLLNTDGKLISEVNDRSRAALEFEIPDWEGDQVRSMIRAWRFYRLVPTAMRNLNPSAATDVLNEHGDNLSSWLMTLQNRYRDAYDKILHTLRDVFPEVQNLYARITEQSTVFAVAQERGLKRLTPISHMSDGQLCFIALASLILAPEELGAPLFCVEEPENYLHPRLMETLFTLLNQRQQELGEERSAQVIITTHSLSVIDQFGLDDLVVVQKIDGETVCTRPREKQHLRELLAREEAGLGQLYYSGSLS